MVTGIGRRVNMPGSSTAPQRRRWADIIVIAAAAYAFGAALWFPPEMISGDGGEAVAFGGWLWTAYALGGAIGLASVFVAIKLPKIARGMVALAGLLVLSGFFALRQVTFVAVLSLGLTGLALLAATPFMGRMPTPEEEGKSR